MDYSFFDSLLDAIFIVDENRRVKYCNESGATLLQSSVRRITKGEGAELHSLLKLSNEDLFASGHGDLGKDAPTPWEEVDMELLQKDFTGKIQVAIQPFQDPSGDKRWVVTFHDVTLEESLHQKYQGELEQKEDMIKELKEARATLENYSKNLEQMVEERTRELSQANTMLKAIMNSLGQGFLVFDKSGWCGEIYTRACLDVLESEPPNKNIIEVLGLDGVEKEQFENWSTATFSQALPFESMKELAPQNYDHSKNKFISLDYFPIETEDGGLGNIVLVATDKTTEVEANRALEKERLFANMVVKLIKNRNHFSDFLKGVEGLIHEVRDEVKKGAGKLNVDYLFRILHTLEGEAGAFHAGGLRQASRDFQGEIEGLRAGDGNFDFEKLNGCIRDLESAYKDFLSDNNEIFSVVLFNKSRMVEVPLQNVDAFSRLLKEQGVSDEIQSQFQNDFLKKDLKEVLGHLDEVAREVAKKQEKLLAPVKFYTNGIRVYPDHYRDFVSSLVHAFRNAVDHGLETPEDRVAGNKAEAGTIEVSAQYLESGGKRHIQLVIQDDGRGIDPERIRSKLQENGVQVDGMDDREILQQILSPGFTSRNEVSEFSGRGVGMDAIKSEVEKLNGTILVESKIGEGTKITIEIPDESGKNVYALSA